MIIAFKIICLVSNTWSAEGKPYGSLGGLARKSSVGSIDGDRIENFDSSKTPANLRSSMSTDLAMVMQRQSRRP